MVEHLWSSDDRGGAEAEAALANRLRFAAQSLTMEYPELSPAQAEQLIFDVAREFLSAAQVAQFVPTLATRRARHLLRNGEVEIVLSDAPIEDESSTVNGNASTPAAREAVPAPASAPPRPPAYYAGEAKRLLEKARTLRTNTLLSVGADE